MLLIATPLPCSCPGGIFVGKTNLDQFACGLVGTRTPYGIPGEMTQTAGSAYALADMRQLGSMQQAAHYLVKMRSIAVA